jgi:hypothetical protein
VFQPRFPLAFAAKSRIAAGIDVSDTAAQSAREYGRSRGMSYVSKDDKWREFYVGE